MMSSPPHTWKIYSLVPFHPITSRHLHHTDLPKWNMFLAAKEREDKTTSTSNQPHNQLADARTAWPFYSNSNDKEIMQKFIDMYYFKERSIASYNALYKYSKLTTHPCVAIWQCKWHFRECKAELGKQALYHCNHHLIWSACSQFNVVSCVLIECHDKPQHVGVCAAGSLQTTTLLSIPQDIRKQNIRTANSTSRFMVVVIANIGRSLVLLVLHGQVAEPIPFLRYPLAYVFSYTVTRTAMKYCMTIHQVNLTMLALVSIMVMVKMHQDLPPDIQPLVHTAQSRW